MIPLLYPGETILVNRYPYIFQKPEIGEIVIVINPKKNSHQHYLVKQIEKTANNAVYVRGINKNKSIDSRDFGWIEKKNIIGKMITKL